MLCDSVYFLVYPYKKINVWAFWVFFVDFYNYAIFPIIFSNCFLLCDEKNKLCVWRENMINLRAGLRP